VADTTEEGAIEADAADAAEDSAAAISQQGAATAMPPIAAKRLGIGVVLLGIGATLLIIFVLPIMVVVGTLPSGIISALIIGFGMRQAWRMTDGTVMTITGPYKVGTPTPAAATAA
jgi:hypothetical protein